MDDCTVRRTSTGPMPCDCEAGLPQSSERGGGEIEELGRGGGWVQTSSKGW